MEEKIEFEYRQDGIEMTVGQLHKFLMAMLPYKENQDVPITAIVEAAMDAKFFIPQSYLDPKTKRALFVFPSLGGITKKEVDRRMAQLSEEIVATVNEAMQANAIGAKLDAETKAEEARIAALVEREQGKQGGEDGNGSG